MIPDLDIYRSANVLVTRHGADASIQAAMRADAMLEAGDLDGFSVWKRILCGRWRNYSVRSRGRAGRFIEPSLAARGPIG